MQTQRLPAQLQQKGFASKEPAPLALQAPPLLSFSPLQASLSGNAVLLHQGRHEVPG